MAPIGRWDEHLRWCDRQIGQHVRNSAQAKRAAKITGIGDGGAWAFTAAVGDFGQFKSGAQFGAWLGLKPRQNASGGKCSLRRIKKSQTGTACAGRAGNGLHLNAGSPAHPINPT